MGHIIAQGIGTASLDTFGGLITNCNPSDLPEGASPRCWDVDFTTGDVFTRAGLAPIYTFTSTIVITSLLVHYGVATFGFLGKTPTVNEGFTLSGFTGILSYLNGMTVFVISVNTVAMTFTAALAVPDAGPFSNLTGTANSIVGNFTGPNPPTTQSTGTIGNVWTNPAGILGNTTFASVTTGATLNSNMVPGVVANTTPSNPWNNPQNFTGAGANVATVTISASGIVSGQSAVALANDLNYAIPSGAQIVGISVSYNASSNGSAGSGVIRTQLAIDGLPVGTAQNTPISPFTAPYTAGGPSFVWGLALSPANINGDFGVLVQALQLSGTGMFSVNGLSVTVYYTTAGVSESLFGQTFSFTIPATSGVSGFGVTFQAYSTAATTVTFQLLKNGVPTGTGHTQVLTTVPTIYTLGNSQDLWGDLWVAGDVNNTAFGVEIVAENLGTTFINDLDMLVYITPALVNFNYIKTYEQNNNQIDTLALDASGIMWLEDVNAAEGVLQVALTGILPGSFAKSSTSDDQEYICFSDLNIGTERPRVYNGIQFLPLSQVGPGAPPLFVSQVGSSANTLTLTAFSISGDVVTFTYSTGIEPTAGEIYTITGATPTYLNYTNTVLSVPPPTSTQFSMEITHPDVTSTPISPTATATLANSYPILSITQPAINPFGFDSVLQSAGPGQTAPGNVLTLYYANDTFPPNAELLAEFATGNAVYVYLSIPSHDILGTYLVTSIGTGLPPGPAGGNRYYFTVNVGNSTYFYDPAHPVAGTYQFTLATVTTSTPIPSLSPGDNITITGATPTGWDNSWPIVSALLSGVMNITSTAMSASGTATYGYTVQSGAPPANGEIVTVFNATNNAIFNATGVVIGSTGGTSGTFNINGFPAGAAIPQAFETQAVGQTFGTEFTFNPGAITVGTNISPIYGNDTGTGNVFTVGGSLVPIGAGTRQAVVFFITESGYETAPSPPIVFTTSSQANVISVINIPIGPPNVIARGIAFTEAGQNGVPGANFYVIENDVTETVFNVTTTYKSTIIRDNVTTSASFTFTDAVLLNSTAIDIQGNDLFNLIELGSCAWCVPYASRMFYGLQLNKVDNFNNLTFDGGYLLNPGGNLFPLGWNYVGTSNQNLNLIVSPITGMALHIFNNTAAVLPNAGVIVEGAYLDPYNVAIINTNTTYSVRVAVSAPSGLTEGTLQISLQSYNPSIGLGATYGTFQVPLSQMTSNMQVFTGTLLINPFVAPTNPLPTNLNLVVQVLGLGIGADVLIDRIEVFPTEEPYILAQVYGSYVDNLEAIDASGSGGIVDTSAENPQACMGGFVMHDTLYLLKTDSLVSTEDNAQSEPGGWGVHEGSQRIGAVGINSYDTGEEWLLTACRSGIYGFNGGAPVKIMQELWDLWNKINWDAGRTIWLRNDLVNKRILCAIPLPTPNKWLPFDPLNVAPTTPNVILMCNYQGLNTFEELISSPGVHVTMFGTLSDRDMTRKWSIWRIKTPYADFITRQDNISKPLFVCNGIDSSKIYQFLDDQLSDDGVAINGLYTTYGFVNAAKAATVPIFGFHQKRYTVLQGTAYGQGTMQVRALQNTLDARYPYTVPGGVNLAPVMQADWFRPLNQRGNRMFLEFSTSAVNSWFNLSKLLLSGKADNYTLAPTGGGNAGFPPA